MSADTTFPDDTDIAAKAVAAAFGRRWRVVQQERTAGGRAFAYAPGADAAELRAMAVGGAGDPVLSRALVRLGETSLLRGDTSGVSAIVEPLVDACGYLSKSRFGALIVIERQVGLRGLIEGGTVLDSVLSARLLQTIFFPGTALHDLAVVVRGRVIHAAGVQLPLADPTDMPDRTLGSRHRAAVGLSKECDALVLAVSEETGAIRLVERGKLGNPLTLDELRAELLRRLGEDGASLSTGRTAAETAEESAEAEGVE